ncbi:MAG TPA: response regulator [Nitrospira sp.]|nr:response regulator [Nitrospira sp.]
MRPLHILVIDESRKDRASLRRLLDQSPSSFILHEASDHLRGRRSCRTLHPDCILFDVLVDGTLAAGLLNDLKRRTSGKPIPIIVWTSVHLLPLVQAAVQQVGASGWLLKHETTPRELARTIHTVVGAS